MINLTAEERRKFTLWLEQEADNTDLIIKQAEKLKVMIELVNKLRAESHAYRIVAIKFKMTEIQKI